MEGGREVTPPAGTGSARPDVPLVGDEREFGMRARLLRGDDLDEEVAFCADLPVTCQSCSIVIVACSSCGGPVREGIETCPSCGGKP